MPKRCVNPQDNELVRGIRLANKMAEYVGFKVPRKGGGYQPDLYPPCESGKPALTYDEWASGKNSIPDLMAFDPNATTQAQASANQSASFTKNEGAGPK
mmetsp:Transcript_16610/g.25608  ORF Transcript_16610/g.25608 Transcript_16610/m.25608 type:complete len:99 (-) Transcript_16610:669-965(-)